MTVNLKQFFAFANNFPKIYQVLLKVRLYLIDKLIGFFH